MVLQLQLICRICHWLILVNRKVSLLLLLILLLVTYLINALTWQILLSLISGNSLLVYIFLILIYIVFII